MWLLFCAATRFIQSRTLTAALACTLGSTAACGNAGNANRDDTGRSAASAQDARGAPRSITAVNPESSTVPAHDTVSAHAVNWTIDDVLGRLSSGGMTTTVSGPVQAKHMSVPGTRVHVPGAELEVYIYGDANATAQDVDRFDKLMRMPDGALMWQKPPALITVNNLVVLVLTSDHKVREDIRRVLDASHMTQYGVPAP